MGCCHAHPYSTRSVSLSFRFHHLVRASATCFDTQFRYYYPRRGSGLCLTPTTYFVWSAVPISEEFLRMTLNPLLLKPEVSAAWFILYRLSRFELSCCPVLMLQIYYNSFDICKRNVKKVLVPLQPLLHKGFREGSFRVIFEGMEWGAGKALFKGVFKDTMRAGAGRGAWARAWHVERAQRMGSAAAPVYTSVRARP